MVEGEARTAGARDRHKGRGCRVVAGTQRAACAFGKVDGRGGRPARVAPGRGVQAHKPDEAPLEAGLLAKFSKGGDLGRLVALDEAARQGESALERRLAAAYEKDAAAFDEDDVGR
jgi:hypothetical protein